MLPRYMVGELYEDAVNQTVTRLFDVEGVSNIKYNDLLPQLHTVCTRHQFFYTPSPYFHIQ